MERGYFFFCYAICCFLLDYVYFWHFIPNFLGPGRRENSRLRIRNLGGAGRPVAAPRPSGPHGKGKPGASNVRHLENFAVPGLRHHEVLGPAAPRWDTVLSLSFLGRVLPRHQQYHPHQVTA
ncbi:hypothetical protein DQ04_06921000 [Trypanosoma grayi]|uniref:hypothetical protein n=1 Tax=Trypanosoma grayi TaxID=71804 RepID=UPI0004F4B65C|nr:hypothetical protein DQ04_06921000 [Trypanosoma grayi]KEG08554.1 hypothetical protein DQ04_06921000 [Trypanosoma grayi]